MDDDGIPNESDNCVLVANTSQADADHDGIGDACDNCVDDFNPAQSDVNHDDKGDLCDATFAGSDLTFDPQHLCMKPNYSPGEVPGGGYIILRGFLDASNLSESLQDALMHDGLVVGISGGLLPQIEVMEFQGARCLSRGTQSVRCVGNLAEDASFRRRGRTGNLYTVRIVAKQRSFGLPLSGDGLEVVFATGGTDLRFAIGGCRVMASGGVRCFD